jgi:hypothetical protein
VEAVNFATDSAFISGLHTAMFAGVVIAGFGAIIALFVKTQRVSNEIPDEAR